MFLAKLIMRARKLIGLPAEAEWDCFHSVKPFRAILQRTRARADRSGGEFSLVVFSTEHLAADLATLVHLTKALRSHLRLSDVAGWLDGCRLGVVLDGTSTEGAWIFADRVCLAFPAGVPLPECRVYRYPSDWLSADEDRAGAFAELPADEKPVHAMEPLFAQETPIWKRSLDLIGASAGLIALAPLLALVAVAIKVSSPGPVFFRQWRYGRGGRRFQLIKFRSMVVDADSKKQELMDRNEQESPAFKIKADPRLTRLGRYMRAPSIDELPQLWHVLTGDMSLVGPRPMDCREVEACCNWQRRRLDATPGLTCTWQVKGRSRVSFADWMRMDIRYIQSRSLWQDLKLIVQTVPVVVLGKGY